VIGGILVAENKFAPLPGKTYDTIVQAGREIWL
jgi:hypothetical protein